MKYIYVLIMGFLAVSTGGCVNYKTASQIINHPSGYTGIDQLIRIDGYFFEESQNVYSPFIFWDNGKHTKYFFRFGSHKEIHENLDFLEPGKGYYTISNDTITVRWVRSYNRFSYHAYEEFFVIINDTTLNRVHYTINGEARSSPQGSDVYRFYPFDFGNLK